MTLTSRATATRTAAVALAALTLAACGGGPDLTADTREVTNADTALTSIEKTWRASLANENVTVHKDARCYLATPTDGTEIADTAYCGPVRYLTDTAATWDSIAMTATQTSKDKATVAANKDTFKHAQNLPAGYQATRPDGKTPPKDLALAEPTAPPGDPDYLTVLTPEDTKPAVTDKTAPKNSLVITPNFTIQVTSAGRTKTTFDGDDPHSAAPGHALHVLDLDVQPATTRPYGEDNMGQPIDLPETTSFTATINGQERPLDAEPFDSTGTRTLIASIPDGTTDATLNITIGTVTQSVSLTTGERAPTNTAAATYYDAGKDHITIPDGTYAHKAVKGDLDATLYVTVSEAWRNPYDANQGWAKPSRVFITVPLDKYDLPNIWQYTLNPRHNGALALTDSTGHTYTNTNTDSGDYVVFDIPATERTLTLTIDGTGTFTSTSAIAHPASGTITMPKKDIKITF